MFRSKLVLSFSLLIITLPRLTTVVESKCSKGCDLAFGSYNFRSRGTLLPYNLPFISALFAVSTNEILSYNNFFDYDDPMIFWGRINIPFTCDCIDGELLAHVFPNKILYLVTYDTIAETYYSHLTTTAMLEQFNSYRPSEDTV